MVIEMTYSKRCNSIGKNGTMNIVKITNSNKKELLVVDDLAAMFERKFIFELIIYSNMANKINIY